MLLVVRSEENLRKCFYRENRVEEELNGGTSPVLNNIYKSPPDLEEDDDEILAEEHHWEDAGGEVFDDEEQKPAVMNEESEVDKFDDAGSDLIPILSAASEMEHHKYGHVESTISEAKHKHKKGRKNKKGKKGRHDKDVVQHLHTRRSQESERTRRNAPWFPDSNKPAETEKLMAQSEIYDILHKFNDTLDVTSGNSSFSSSEEFLEQCRDAILMVELNPYIDWYSQISIENILDSWKFDVNSTDYYYFIFTSDNSIELNFMGFKLEMERATYDVSAPLQACRNSTECVFPLAFTQSEAVVVEVPAAEDLIELHSFEVTTACQPRVPVYMVFILLVPFIILIFAFQ